MERFRTKETRFLSNRIDWALWKIEQEAGVANMASNYRE